ncbi:MFS transporter [Nocardioides sp. ChNu-153]|uniref:MFS transporter n=1 Tax=unclassified Nocardioides TaxID=2615069 RepID=UPI0024051DD4|nr:MULTISPECIES: MFS transporter [unclassified Nocardioides]MDF9714632.1 MFS transporter [Nocardioides sp. ChNu-99]MDN7119834.1 MFS transporter [Nocardioides sp. ChNu-153]
MSRTGRLAVVAALVAVAASTRSPLTSVPPLVGDLDRALGLSSVAVGLLTALPVLCMGALAPVATLLAVRLGLDRALTVGAVAVAVGTAARPWGGVTLLYGGTFVAGAGIAIVGALLPGAVKRHFPRRPGAMTGAYMAAMMTTATLAAALAVPLSGAAGWRAALGVWALPAAVGAVWWVLRVRGTARPAVAGTRGAAVGARGARLPWRSPSAWLVTAYLTTSSVMFYSLLAWIAPSYVDRGWGDGAAGLLLAGFSAAQLGAALLVPLAVDRLRDRRGLYAAAGFVNVVGLAALVVAPGWSPWAVVLLLGFGNGAAFTLGLTQLVEHAATAQDSARLAGMAFLVSYLVAALGPTGIGALHDAAGSWTPPFVLLACVAVAQVVTALGLGPTRRVGAEGTARAGS